MFRIECYCDDKKLHEVLKALVGKVIGAPVPTPVINAEKKNGKVEAETSGAIEDMFVTWLKKKHLTEVTAIQMQEYMQHLGKSPKSYSNLLRKCKEARILKPKRGAAGIYQVNL